MMNSNDVESMNNSIDRKDEASIKRYIKKLSKLVSSEEEPLRLAYYYYNLANLYSAMAKLKNESSSVPMNGEVAPFNNIHAMNCYRNSIDFFNTSDKDGHEICFSQVKTNLANQLKAFNRCVEAIPFFCLDFSVKGDAPYVSSISMAECLIDISQSLTDPGHKYEYYELSYKLYKNLEDNKENTAYSNIIDRLHEPYAQNFREWFKKVILEEDLLADQKPLSNTEEKVYRKWCAENRLFLNNMNDIAMGEFVQHDVLQFSNYRMRDEDECAPFLSAAFSAIKRDYMAARYIAYEGLFDINNPEYEMQGSYLVDTQDGVDYSLSTQKLTIAYRLVFSVLDSLARLLFKYFNPETKEEKIYFTGNKIKKLNEANNNKYIKALYWLACDFLDSNVYESDTSKAPKPVFYKLKKLRHAFEHEYVRVINSNIEMQRSSDDYAYTITRESLNDSLMRLFSCVRYAIIYSILAINTMERTHDSNNRLAFETPISPVSR